MCLCACDFSLVVLHTCMCARHIRCEAVVADQSHQAADLHVLPCGKEPWHEWHDE